jgi:hypothetical protein
MLTVWTSSWCEHELCTNAIYWIIPQQSRTRTSIATIPLQTVQWHHAQHFLSINRKCPPISIHLQNLEHFVIRYG